MTCSSSWSMASNKPSRWHQACHIPSGKNTRNYGKPSPFFNKQINYELSIFMSYLKLPNNVLIIVTKIHINDYQCDIFYHSLDMLIVSQISYPGKPHRLPMVQTCLDKADLCRIAGSRLGTMAQSK